MDDEFAAGDISIFDHEEVIDNVTEKEESRSEGFGIEQSRQIRRQQDEEFAESLRIDQEKVPTQ